ncbi:MAG: hypothetical protein LBI10_11350 [Deltaproteobacteria bacterium]|nr:hypothetical protein [Deltaproteobacteria bacterium]
MNERLTKIIDIGIEEWTKYVIDWTNLYRGVGSGKKITGSFFKDGVENSIFLKDLKVGETFKNRFLLSFSSMENVAQNFCWKFWRRCLESNH